MTASIVTVLASCLSMAGCLKKMAKQSMTNGLTADIAMEMARFVVRAT